MNSNRILCALPCMLAQQAQAEITRHGGSDVPLSDRKYVHVVSEKVAPVMQTAMTAR